MDFAEFRKKGREVGILLDHHHTTEPMWVFMPYGRALAIRPGHDSANALLAFAATHNFELMYQLEWHYALVAEIERTDIALHWHPFRPVDGEGHEIVQNVVGYTALRTAGCDPPRGCVFFRDWMQDGVATAELYDHE